MSSYRLNFLEALSGGPSLTPPPRHQPYGRIRLGTERDMVLARQARVRRIFLVLLLEADVPYTMVGDGSIHYGDQHRAPEADLVERLWNDANMLVGCGRDLH